MPTEIQKHENTNLDVMPEGAAAALPQAAENRKFPPRKAWLWFAVGLCVALSALAMFWTSEGPDIDTSHLPKWFDRAHRIQSIPGQAGKYFKDVGIFKPPSRSVAAESSPEWLEKNFTHYLGEDAFVWAQLSNKIPDGKLLAGCKIIYGAELNECALICVYAPDCGAVNMFVNTAVLRERSQGPPPPRQQHDD